VSDDLYDTASFTWSITGTKAITVTASNSEGMTTTTHAITITELSTRDDYETDDICAEAQAITADGTPQIRTFHTTDDMDWAFFQAISGATYIVEAITPDDSEADVVLALYDGCDGTVQDGQDNAFSPDISLSFTAPQNGSLYLRLADDRNASGDEATTYYLSVRALAETAPTGAVVIVAGKNKPSDGLQPNIYHVTNGVYQLFRDNGYSHDTITYLAPDDSLDADNDEIPDVDAISTKTNLEQAITQWVSNTAGTDQPFTLYMMDHGSYDGFYLNYLDNQPKTVSAYELDGWLDQLEAARPDLKINLIVEACHSGSFIDLQ
jgi:hypothetical protein